MGPRGEIKNSSSVRFLALPYGEQWRRLTLFLDDMEAAGVVEYAMISGMPFLKKWSENEPFARPRYYLDSSSRMVLARDTDYLIATAFLDYRRAFADDEEELQKLSKLYPLICGYDTTDLGAVDLVIKRIKEFPGVWHGIGEVMSRHDDLTNLTTGDRPRGNHPSLKRLCCLAGDVHLPVNIHHNIAPVSRNAIEVKEPLYLDELIELFEYCRPPMHRMRPSSSGLMPVSAAESSSNTCPIASTSCSNASRARSTPICPGSSTKSTSPRTSTHGPG